MNLFSRSIWLSVAAIGLIAGAGSAHAESVVQHIKVHSAAIAGNLQGNSADRDVLVYLPPSYAENPDRRYPVLYHLHGWFPNARQWAGMINLQEGADRAIASGESREMIVVIPDANVLHEGAMYSSSVTTGDFEKFVTEELIAYIDANYRTIPERASRGMSGHSMGGYGAIRVAMKFPHLYSSLYAMSSCCLSPQPVDDLVRQAAEIQTVEEAASAPVGPRITLSQAAAWSPNPHRPPFYFDFAVEDGEVRPDIVAKWAANAPLIMVDQYIGNLRSYRAIAMDIGLQDGLIADNEKFSEVLTSYDIDHIYETYEGEHVNKAAERFETRVLPFFSRELEFP